MSVAQNNKTIDNAFARLLRNKDMTVQNGLAVLMDKAMEYALEAHNEDHANHIEIGDSYGWVVAFNGVVKDIRVNSGRWGQADAEEALRHEASVSGGGWVAILMAGMNPPVFYKTLYEVDILNETIRMTKQNFNKYFYKVK